MFGDTTLSEAGRRGGLVVRQRYGRDHYTRIGRIGGLAFSERHDPGLADDMRRRGGETVRDRLGRDHLRRIGQTGGAATSERHADMYPRLGRLVRDRYGRGHYARLSALSAATLSYLVDLSAARQRLGLSGAALSRRSGVSREAIRAFEQLERGARWATVEKLADAMGVEPHDLLGGGRRPGRRDTSEEVIGRRDATHAQAS